MSHNRSILCSLGRRIGVAGLVLPLALALTTPLAAEETPPDELVRATTEDVLELLEENREQIEENPARVFEAVQELVLPNFDFELMSRFVLARNWEQANADQRERFTGEFRNLLVRTYGSALSEYSGQEVEYPPMQSDTEEGRAKVPTEIIQPDGPAIPIGYSLYRTEDGWKVYDVEVDGVSLVQNYRSSFASEVKRNGIDGLIERLEERNARGAVDEELVE